MLDFTQLVFDVTYELKQSGVTVLRSHAHEVLAALLGYGSHAAFLEDRRASPLEDVLQESEHAVLQKKYALSRARKIINNDYAPILVETIISKLIDMTKISHPHLKVHGSYRDFRDDHLFEMVVDDVFNSDELSIAFTDTNASCDEVYPDSFIASGPIRKAIDTWSIKTSGTISGTQDPDRPYSGHEGAFEATYIFEKLGRIGLRYQDSEVAAGIDQDSWRDLDY